MENGTELGRRVKPIYDSGGLVPDDLMIELIRERLARPDAEAGFVFDGFPRTSAQADALDEMLEEIGRGLDIVFEFQLPWTTSRRSGSRSGPSSRGARRRAGRDREAACPLPRADGAASSATTAVRTLWASTATAQSTRSSPRSKRRSSRRRRDRDPPASPGRATRDRPEVDPGARLDGQGRDGRRRHTVAARREHSPRDDDGGA